MKKVWTKMKRFIIWLRIHHFKNFIAFWIRAAVILVALFVGVWIWFTDTPELGFMTSLGAAVVIATTLSTGYKPMKRLYKKYMRYLKQFTRST